MKVMRMRAVQVTFSVVLFIAICVTGSSDNPLVEGTNLKHNCSQEELSLNMSKSIITLIGENFISSPLITCLNLQGNKIESVEMGAFDSVPALEYLNIAENMINGVMSFGGHENLRTLILANQSVYNEQVLRIFGEYPQLHYLDLSGNSIRSINWRINNHGYLEDFIRKYDNIFPKLEYLDLSYNSLTYLFNDDSNLSSNLSLTHLFVQNNNLNILNLLHFPNLRVLIADSNRLYTLRGGNNYCYGNSMCVSYMPKLKYLSISRNELYDIDSDFFKSIPALTALNLTRNQLNHKIYGIFHYLISLENLYLDNNLLSNISLFDRPSQLSSLSLNFNNIERVDSEDLINTPDLRKLYLNDNKITDIHENAFRSLELLEELYLANNILNKLPAKWSNNLKSLRYLDLTNNKIMYLESLSLSDTLPLKHIDLIDNQIISFTTKILYGLPENVTIYLTRDQRKVGLDPGM